MDKYNCTCGEDNAVKLHLTMVGKLNNLLKINELYTYASTFYGI